MEKLGFENTLFKLKTLVRLWSSDGSTYTFSMENWTLKKKFVLIQCEWKHEMLW